MTVVNPSTAHKKVSPKSRRRKEKKKERRRNKGKVRLDKRLERYKKILIETKAARAKTSNPLRLKLHGRYLELSSKIVALVNNPVAARYLPSPGQVNPQVTMSGNCFWLNYQNVFNWKDHHMSNIAVYSSPKLPLQRLTVAQASFHQDRQNTYNRIPNKPSEVTSSRNKSGPNQEYYEIDEAFNEDVAAEGEEGHEPNDSDSDIVVTEEMMQFLEISMRHKANREREKLAARELEKRKQLEERDAIEDCQAPTEEDENEKRHREMSELYGKDAAKIQGMETAVQLNFNRQLDLFSPSHWPFYPFSMQFKGVTALK